MSVSVCVCVSVCILLTISLIGLWATWGCKGESVPQLPPISVPPPPPIPKIPPVLTNEQVLAWKRKRDYYCYMMSIFWQQKNYHAACKCIDDIWKCNEELLKMCDEAMKINDNVKDHSADC